MQFNSWDTLFNLLLLVFWYRIWSGGERAAAFNPYLAPLARLSDRTTDFLRPVFFGCSARVINVITFLFLLVLRGAAAPREPGAWILVMGFEARQPAEPAIAAHVVFSGLSFLLFLFKLWGLSLIFVRSRGEPSLHTTSALYHLSRPFTRILLHWRPAFLFLCGLLILFLVHSYGAPARAPIPGVPASTPPDGPILSLLIRFSISSLSAWVGVLGILQQVVILLIIGSWISLFTGSQGIAFYCREWMDTLLGPLRRHPIRIGMLDLSPLVFIFAVAAIQLVLQSLLLQSYFRLT